MSTESLSEIDAKVKKSLEHTAFECSSLKPLSGGSVNWAYLLTLSKPLDNGAAEVMVKHGETHMMSKPEVALTLVRCRIESECLRCLSDSTFAGKADSTSPYNITVRTPKFYHNDVENANQFLEYLPNGTTLKDYIMKYYAAPTSESAEPEARQIGKSLGSWLRSLVRWGASHPELRAAAAENIEAQTFRHMLEFLWLGERVKEYPAILGCAKETFAEVEKAAAAEMRDETTLQVVHGDFWTGNVLMPDAPIRKGMAVPVLIIDWEMAHLGVPNLDLGEMIAEMYTIWLYKSIPAALWMMEAFVGAYGEVTEEHAFRTAIQVGAHIVCVTSTVGWGPPEQVEEAVGIGRDIIVHAWGKNRSWFEKGELACIFRQVP